jgi:hypothetical protein
MDNCLSTNTTKEETPPHKKYQILYVIGTGTFGKVYLVNFYSYRQKDLTIKLK